MIGGIDLVSGNDTPSNVPEATSFTFSGNMTEDFTSSPVDFDGQIR